MKKIFMFICLMIYFLSLLACSERTDLKEKKLSSAFIKASKEALISCLGKPQDEKEVHNTQYWTYLGKNNCRIIFTIKNHRVKSVDYAAANGKCLAPKECPLNNQQSSNDLTS